MNQIDPLLIAISLAWLACIFICVLKGKYGTAIIGVAAAVAQYIGLPPIGGYYILNVIYPLAFVPFWGALRLAHPESYYAFWFYRNNPQKYMRAVTRYGMETEYSDLQKTGIDSDGMPGYFRDQASGRMIQIPKATGKKD
jgi:hypothetical protein